MSRSFLDLPFLKRREIAREYVDKNVVCNVTRMVDSLLAAPCDIWDEKGLEFTNYPEELEDHESWPEVQSYLVVSDAAAQRLVDLGELVYLDFLGHCVWGRQTAGQDISLDYVIEKAIQATYDWREEMRANCERSKKGENVEPRE